jgi:hypothetical protein
LYVDFSIDKLAVESHTEYMVNQALLDFVSGEVAKGTPLPEVRSMLAQKGWQTTDIDGAFAHFSYGKLPQESVSQALPQGQTPGKNSSKQTCLIVGIVGCIGCLGLVVVLGVFSSTLLVGINPLALIKQANVRAQRATMKSTQMALLQYYSEKSTFPDTLSGLIPDHMAEEPVDIFSHTSLQYTKLQDGKDFSLCGYFADEKKDQVCIDSQTEEIAPQLFPSPSVSE